MPGQALGNLLRVFWRNRCIRHLRTLRCIPEDLRSGSWSSHEQWLSLPWWHHPWCCRAVRALEEAFTEGSTDLVPRQQKQIRGEKESLQPVSPQARSPTQEHDLQQQLLRSPKPTGPKLPGENALYGILLFRASFQTEEQYSQGSSL